MMAGLLLPGFDPQIKLVRFRRQRTRCILGERAWRVDRFIEIRHHRASMRQAREVGKRSIPANCLRASALLSPTRRACRSPRLMITNAREPISTLSGPPFSASLFSTPEEKGFPPMVASTPGAVCSATAPSFSVSAPMEGISFLPSVNQSRATRDNQPCSRLAGNPTVVPGTDLILV